MSRLVALGDVAVMDDAKDEIDMEETGRGERGLMRSPMAKTRSLSDGGGTPSKPSPAPHIIEAARRTSKDDSTIRDSSNTSSNTSSNANANSHAISNATASTTNIISSLPSTPIRAGFPLRGLAIQMPQRDARELAREANVSPTRPTPDARPAPLSPKLDHSHIYASPNNILPRRSRGLDFSRAATSLHHSTLANQGSPGSSPTIGSRAMNIPGRRSNDYGIAESSSNSLWTVMGNNQHHYPERSNMSSSMGSTMQLGSDSSSTSDDDDFMDEDLDETFVTTPQVTKTAMTPAALHPTPNAPWMPGGSPAVNNLMSFQQRQRPRRQSRKKLRGPLGLGFHSLHYPPASLSRSPPNNVVPRDMAAATAAAAAAADAHARRESISWAANQLHISGSESDDPKSRLEDGVDSPSRPSVIKRAVTRRGNLLPKTKGFARIRAALAEESAPVEAEVAREAEVVRQVRESDMDIEARPTPHAQRLDSVGTATTTALSSPNLDNPDDIAEDAMMVDSGSNSGSGPAGLGLGLGLSGSFKQQALRNSKGKDFWDTFSETSGSGGGSGRRGSNPSRMTPPPPLFGLARGSSAGLSLESDMNMDSPGSSSCTNLNGGTATGAPATATATATATAPGGQPSNGGPPTAAEITRRINNKRRRDDDFDPVSFKRRAVSPGMSVHNSPIMQSPLQRDVGPWGNSRPGSVGGDGTASGGNNNNNNNGGGGRTGSGGSGAPSESGGSQTGRAAGKGFARVGFQGMIDTNDGITKLSIE